MHGLMDTDLTYQQIMNMRATREAASWRAIAGKAEQCEGSCTSGAGDSPAQDRLCKQSLVPPPDSTII